MRYLLIDTSNVVKGAILHGKDKEFGRRAVNDAGKEFHVNGADYGFDTAVDFLKARMEQFGFAPKDLIFVVEGPNSKMLRTSISDTYKANRTGDKKLPQEQYDEINKCRDRLLAQFLRLGAQSVTQGGLEADDILAYLAKTLPETYTVTTDGDAFSWASDRAHVISGSKLDQIPYLHGTLPPRFTTLYKALVGDTSDGIKGAKGFGEKAFLDLFCIWGEEGLAEVERLILTKSLEELIENVPELKALQRVVDDRENVYICYDLARVYPEKVNTWRKPLEWRCGVVEEMTAEDSPALKDYFAKRKIVHATNFDSTLEWFKREIKNATYIGYDIETSSSEESDDWQARKSKKDPDSDDIGVDVFGHQLTSCSFTFGPNDNYSIYLPFDHAEEPSGPRNLQIAQLVQIFEAVPQTLPIVVHNSAFELSVMEREIGEFMRDNGWHGFLPNVHCTRLLATYVDENGPMGLKDLSLRDLDYEQTTYKEVTLGRKMRELTAKEAFNYGTDDTRCTVALYNHYRTRTLIEGTFQIYIDVERDPAYLTALAFNQGTPISMEKLLELEREDKQAFDASWATLRDFLMAHGWAGTVCPQAATAADVTAPFIKEAHLIVTGEELKTLVRTPSKLLAMLAVGGQEMLASCLNFAVNDGDVDPLNNLIKLHFQGEPQFNLDSPVQKTRLLYEVMGLPVRLRNKATDAMRAEGRKEGNPRADDLAMQWAIQNDVQAGTPVHSALKALQTMLVTNTRRKMFYEPYRAVQHWKDNLVHANMTQNGAGTRRYTSSGPNLQQLPKHPKATGEPARFREVFVPHHSKAVIVSLDFSGQELRLIADYSQDPNMLACYVGDDLKDMHSLTAAGILKKKAMAQRFAQLWTTAGRSGAPADAGPDGAEMFRCLVQEWQTVDYAGFVALESGPWKALYKTLRALGKKTNFTTEYGAQAPKLAETLLVDEDEAQQYIDAKLAAFPRAEAWKREVCEIEFHKLGYTTTMMGARRHLADALRSGNSYEIGKADRQGVNFKIQGSAAEMTKLAMGRIWRAGLCFKYDARFIAPIHDEVVFSVGIADLAAFLTELHALMVAPYASMQVPVISSISIGLNFGQQVELGEAVDPALIKRVLYLGYSDGKDHPPLFPDAANDADMQQAA